MLVSITLGVFILCVIYVAYWSVKNDAAKSIEEQVGFIRMRLPKGPRLPARKRDTSAAASHPDKPNRC